MSSAKQPRKQAWLAPAPPRHRRTSPACQPDRHTDVRIRHGADLIQEAWDFPGHSLLETTTQNPAEHETLKRTFHDAATRTASASPGGNFARLSHQNLSALQRHAILRRVRLAARTDALACGDWLTGGWPGRTSTRTNGHSHGPTWR